MSASGPQQSGVPDVARQQGDPADVADASPAGSVETPWRRLDPRMLVVGSLGSLAQFIPVIAVLLLTGQGGTSRLWAALGVVVVAVMVGVVRWRSTKYRITGERVELHSGWLRRRRRSVPRDRIRTVDLTAGPLHRVFGLSVVQVGAASGAALDDSGLSLNAVTKAEAERLRRALLDRGGRGGRRGDRAAGIPEKATPENTTLENVDPASPERAPVQELARLRWAWIRFAPLTASSLAGMGAAGAAAYNLLDDLDVDPRDIGAVDAAADSLADAPVWLGVAVIGVVLLAVAVVGALALFTERWYGYRLTREPDGTLRVRRGLLTRRSLSVSEQRLRGVEITEPLLLRAGRGAQCGALSTGLGRVAQGGALQPPVPRAEAFRVASAALREHPSQITEVELRRHPRAALARRLSRALGPAAVLVAMAWVLGSTVPDVPWVGPAGLALLPLAALLGLDRYRNLGHALTARYLVSRRGSLRRRTVALQRAGVIGWTFRQSVFQRRAGLVTLEAVTAAGEGGYAVPDVGAADAVGLADAAVPDLLTPFLPPPPRLGD